MAACRQPGVSIASVALANGLNANLLRRWVVSEEQARGARSIETASAPPARLEAEGHTFIPLRLEKPAARSAPEITMELRRGATVVKVTWPLAGAADCAVWLRELLR
jgi:transposase